MKEQGYEQLTLFPEGFPVSLSPKPGNMAALEMTVTSGLKCSGLYGNSSPLGSLVKMCMGSSIWHSTRCFLIWKTKGTKHRRLLFQLAASMPRTDGTELPLWPTPMASSWGGSGHRATLKRMQEKGLITEEERMSLQSGNWGKTNPELIEWLMGYTKAFTQLLPTPIASMWKGGCPKRYVGGQIRQQPPESHRIHSPWENWPDESGLGRVADGVPNRVDRIRSLGNAVIPQQFYLFFKLIADIEGESQ